MEEAENKPSVSEVENEPSVSEAENEPLVSKVENEPSVSEAENEPLVSKVENEPSVSEAENEPLVSKTENEPLVSKAENEPSVSEAENKPSVRKTENESSVSKTENEPLVSKTENEPLVSKTENEPLVSKTENEPSVSEAENEPSVSEAEKEPSVSEAENEPSVSEAENEPSVSEAENEPSVSEAENEPSVSEAQLEEWRKIQDDLKKQLIEDNTEAWQDSETFEGLELIGGADISFVKNSSTACVALVVCSFPDLEVVEKVFEIIEMTVPYASGFLAFREIEFFKRCLEKLEGRKPQIIMVDGNGILHQRGFGTACHLGVHTGLPCIGIAKKLMQIDGLEKDENFQLKKKELLKFNGDSFDLIGDSMKVWGKALKSTKDSNNPIFVSVGHKISLEAATKLVHKCCLYRIPEPVRQADVQSREKLREL